jgi:hypothetical protein
MPERVAQPSILAPATAGAGYMCKVDAQVWATIDRDTNHVFIWTRLNISTPDNKPIFSPSGHRAEQTANYQPIPLKRFKSEQDIAEFVRAVRTRFEAYAPLLMAAQAAMYLNGCVDLQDNETFPRHPEDVVDAPMLITEHLRETEYIMRLIYNEPRPGTRSKWTAITISREVRSALVEIRPSRLRTLENVAEKLKAKHPDKAPKSGEALRKLLTRLKVDWQKLKDEADS